MSRIAEYLQNHLSGEVTTSADARRYFSTDASIFELTPQVVVYPRNTSDVRKVARFTWQLAEKGKVVPITARGKGTDLSGAAIGHGVMMVFPAHMKKILELDPGKGTTTVQPGIVFETLQHTLKAHGRFLPPYPSSADYATIGGAIANNSAGEQTVKYGSMKNFVRELDVVLANGELIHTKRLSKRELNRKQGLTNFEGEIYRALGNLINDHWDVIKDFQMNVTKNTAGYNIFDVRRKDGSFDLTPLIVGSQGTLGIVTQGTLHTEPYNPNPTLLVAQFDNLDEADNAIQQLKKFNPSTMEVVDKFLLEFVEKQNPKMLKDLIKDPIPDIVLLVEFDESGRGVKRKIRKARQLLEKYAQDIVVTNDEHERDNLWKIRHSAAIVAAETKDAARAVPIIEDGVVPVQHLTTYVKHVRELFKKAHLEMAMWGHGGDCNFHMQPFLDLGKVGDRQKAFKLMDDYYNMVIELGGSTAGEHNDGRLRAKYLKQLYGPEIYGIFEKVKQIFDPYGTLNPGVKMGVDPEEVKAMVRQKYSIEHLSDHLPKL